MLYEVITLNRTKLDGADFSRAMVGLTSFGDSALNVVKGLDSVEHRGPSTIGTPVTFEI